MKKINYGIILIIAILFIAFLPNFSRAAKVSVGKINSIKVVAKNTSFLKLSWKSVRKATGYRIYVYNTSKKKYESVGKTKNKTYTLKNLKSAQEFKIRVKAYRTVNKKNYYGDYSKIITTATLPTQVINLKASSQTETTLSITWNKVTRASGYKVYMYNELTKKYQEKATTTKNSVKLSNLSVAKNYKIKVRAYKTANNRNYYGAYSSILDTATLPNKVTNLKVVSFNETSIKIQWNKVDKATGYAVYVYRESNQDFKLYSNTTNTSINITNLKAAKFYKIYVKAYVTINKINYYSKKSDIISQKTKSTYTSKAGIDVSQHQGKIDWEKVSEFGVDFAIIRLGWIGNLENHTIDTQFERNYSECKRLGIPVGVYIYCYSNCPETAESGARWAVEKLRGKTLDLPVFIDMEDSSIVSTGKKNLSNICIAFNRIIEEANFKPGIYANRYWYDNYLDNALKTKYTCWIAHYTSNENIDYKGLYEIWQYSSQGKTDGISGYVDLDIMYIEIE